MLEVFLNKILPVFALFALGFIMGRNKATSGDEARALNRFGLLVLQPALILTMLAGYDFTQMHWGAIGTYLLCEVVVFGLSFSLARYGFQKSIPEAALLSMTVIFVNSLLYVGTIAVLIYGEAGAAPILAIVALDTAITFAVMIIAMELLTGTDGLNRAGRRILRNPILIAIVGGVALNLAGILLPEGVLTFTRITGAAAVPVTLFALGVVLSHGSLIPDRASAGFVALKLLLFPLVVAGALALFHTGGDWTDRIIMNSAGPSGAMAFSLALMYGVRTETIAQVILWTGFLSLIPLTFLA
ncbi:MAG TPA: AEC family transporter [Paracoccaceae bacterium]|nr:AEC family transporter [Paracoccaceae bacterium]